MHIQTLPNYSCERYYLLSEIEQRAELVFIDEPESKNNELRSTQNPRIDVMFLLWNAADGLETVKMNIQKVLDRHPSCLSRCLIVVECLVASEKEFLTEVKDEIESLFKWANKVCPESFLFVGVSDKPTGTPGLEKVEDFLKFTVAAASGTAGNIRFLGVMRQDCLGHDPVREPDGGNDVYQVLCCSSAEAYAAWEKVFKEYVQTLYGVEDVETVLAADSKDAAAKPKNKGLVVFLVLLAVLMAAMAVLYQYSKSAGK